MRQRNKVYGLFIGKFLPPHLGHIDKIFDCAKNCDRLFVVVADSENRSHKLCRDAGICYVSPKTRAKWLSEIFKQNKNIKVKTLRQGMLEAYPENLDNWKKGLFVTTGHHFCTWFVDENFLEISKQTFPEICFVGFDRSKINISSSNIRRDPKKYKKFLINKAKTIFIKYS